jgi:hypothetical protein
MLKRNLCAVAVGVLISSACGGGPPTSGRPTELAAVCEKGNSGERVAVRGYLRFPQSFTGTQSAVLRLYPSADGSGTPIGVQMPIGNGPNQMELPPKQYTEKDLKVHLANGQVVGGDTQVTVSGSVYFPMTGQDFTCALENPLVETAP